MPFFRDLLKDIIHEELEAMSKDTAGAGTAETTAPESSPKQPQEDASNNIDDKTPTETKQPASKATDAAKQTPDEKPDAFNVELRNMIKKEVRGYAADMLNSEAGSGTNTGVNVDDAFAHLLGFSTTTKGDK